MIDLGSEYPAAVDVFNDAGALANPSAATLTITLPDGALADTSGLLLPPAETGKLRFAYITEQPGRHTVRWQTTNPVTAWTDVFDVAPQVSPAIVSLAEAKVQLQIEPGDTGDDDELRSYIEALTEVVEQYKHEVIVPRQVTEVIEIGRGRARRFRVWSAPLISLISVVSWDGTITWDVTQMRASESGLVKVMAGPPVHGDIVATTRAGWQPIPHRYRQGALVILQHVWEVQRGQGTAMSGVIGQEEHYRQPGEWFTIPAKAKEWLGPPRPVVA